MNSTINGFGRVGTRSRCKVHTLREALVATIRVCYDRGCNLGLHSHRVLDISFCNVDWLVSSRARSNARPLDGALVILCSHHKPGTFANPAGDVIVSRTRVFYDASVFHARSLCRANTPLGRALVRRCITIVSTWSRVLQCLSIDRTVVYRKDQIIESQESVG